jgi:diaminopimelate decarboxylase
MKQLDCKPRRQLPPVPLLLGACLLLALAGCGQKGPLYLPDHKPEAVPGAAAPAPATPGSPTENPAARKAPRTPDPATAR